MAGERGLDRDLGRLEVTDLADQDHVGILADDVPEPGGEGQADLRLDGDLVDALQLVLDRIFDGDDLTVRRVDLVEGPVEGRRLAGSGRAGDEEDAVRLPDQPFEAGQHPRREAELLERQEHALAVEETHHDRLAVHRRDRGGADVHTAVVERDADPAVLGQPSLRDVHLGHQLHARGHRRLQPAGRRFLVEEHAVDAVADPERVLEGLDVDVGGLGGDGILDQ